MSHENDNPLIIDVVGEVEPPESSEKRSAKKTARSTVKRSFFKKGKVSSETATRAASEADVDAAKRARVAASVPTVQGPSSQAPAPQDETVQPESQSEQAASSEKEQPIQTQPQPQPQSQPAQASQPAQVDVSQFEAPSQSQSQPVQYSVQPEAFQAQASVQPQSAQSVAAEPSQARPSVQPQPQAQPQPQPQPQSQPQPQPQPQPVAAEPTPTVAAPQPQPAAPATVAFQSPNVPVAAASPAMPGNMAVAFAPQRSHAVYVFIILAVLVVLFAAAAACFYMLSSSGDRTSLAPTGQADLESGEVRPIGSVSLDQASKVSLRATAEGWNEETSTPLIAYIKRVEEVASSETDKKSSSNVADEQYFAFAPNKNASVSLPGGRYTFSFIAPMNSDGSMYTVPDMVNMVVGDGGMAVLPIDLTLIPRGDLTQEQVSRALAQLKTASEKGGESFSYEPFEHSIDLALTSWFPQTETTTEQPAADLTQEQQDALNAQADSQSSAQNTGGTGGTATSEHTHVWVAQHEQRWEPEVVPVIDQAAWESPVYARYRCQEGILFETLDACLAHVRERGNEPYSASNEIIRIDYHPAVVHYEEQGRYVDVVTEYRCNVCGVRGTLN